MPHLPLISTSREPKTASTLKNASSELSSLPRIALCGQPKEKIHEYVEKRKQNFLTNHTDNATQNEIYRLIAISANANKEINEENAKIEEKNKTFYGFMKQINTEADIAINNADRESQATSGKLLEVETLQQEIETINNEIVRNNELLAEAESHLQFLQSVLQHKSPETSRESICLETPGKLLDKFSVFGIECLRFLEVQEDIEPRLRDQQLWLNNRLRELDEQIQVLMGMENKFTQHSNMLKKSCMEQKTLITQMMENISSKPDEKRYEYNSIHMFVTTIYEQIVKFPNDADLSTTGMLTIIEIYLENLLETVERMPRDKVTVIRKERNKKRKLQLYDEKIQAQIQSSKEICPRFKIAYPSDDA